MHSCVSLSRRLTSKENKSLKHVTNKDKASQDTYIVFNIDRADNYLANTSALSAKARHVLSRDTGSAGASGIGTDNCPPQRYDPIL